LTVISALTRPGRFDRHIAVPLPDIRGRVQLLTHFMKDVVTSRCTRLTPSQSSFFISKKNFVAAVDPMVLARGTSGFSGAELQNMVKFVWHSMMIVQNFN